MPSQNRRRKKTVVILRSEILRFHCEADYVSLAISRGAGEGLYNPDFKKSG